MRVNGFAKNLLKMPVLNTSQTSGNKIITLLMIVAIIMPIISNGSVYDYVAIFTLGFFLLNPQPGVAVFSCNSSCH